MSPPQLLKHCWIERVEVTLYPGFFDCLFATIPPLHVSSISVSEIPRSLAESNFRELNISTLAYLCLELNPESHNINFFGNSCKTSNRLTHFCRNKFFFFKIIQPNLISLFCHVWKEFYVILRISTDNRFVELGWTAGGRDICVCGYTLLYWLTYLYYILYCIDIILVSPHWSDLHVLVTGVGVVKCIFMIFRFLCFYG